MSFDLITDTTITLNDKPHTVRFENGMTGIGSRGCWLDGHELIFNAVRHTDNLTKGNHLLYLIKWRDNPWSKIYIFINEKYEKELLSPENAWREPQKIRR